MSSTAAASPYPIRLGAEAQFARLRELLPATGFVQQNLEGRFYLKHLGEAQFEVQSGQHEVSREFSVLAGLFVQGKSFAASDIEQELGRELFDLLLDLGLVEKAGERCVATVAMVHTNGLYIVSDRWCGVDGQPYQPPVDVVYPAVLGTTRGFLAMLPASPCGSFLELCAGTGIAALLAARNCAKQAWAFDIAARSVHFAEFNSRLNGIENITNCQGDLYAPAAGHKFDRIAAHPPYVPVLEPKFVFYDGGEDGEQITRRMIQELPRYLNDKGLFVCVSLGSDRKGRPFEERVRGWLGAEHEEFDIALFVRSEMEPAVQALNDVVRGRGSVEQVQRWREVLAKLEIVNFAFGGIFISRHGENRAGYTIRRTMSKDAGLPEIEAIMAWERLVARGEEEQVLVKARLRTSPKCRVEARYALENGDWSTERQHLLIDEPFKMQIEAPNWMLQLLPACDGSRTGEDLFEMFKANGTLAAETTFRQFADVLTVLRSGWFLSF
ncbi:MAG TPA: class I SAM-dependent methyltransferase [Terriglobales bacterium]|nr:class I SAM-dependent methyltransferase [Terriglobales bacterium]